MTPAGTNAIKYGMGQFSIVKWKKSHMRVVEREKKQPYRIPQKTTTKKQQPKNNNKKVNQLLVKLYYMLSQSP